jgi:hypothetical protein
MQSVAPVNYFEPQIKHYAKVQNSSGLNAIGFMKRESHPAAAARIAEFVRAYTFSSWQP